MKKKNEVKWLLLSYNIRCGNGQRKASLVPTPNPCVVDKDALLTVDSITNDFPCTLSSYFFNYNRSFPMNW